MRTELEEYKRLAEAGEIKAVDYLRLSRGVEAQVADQEILVAEARDPAGAANGDEQPADTDAA